MLIEVASVGQ